MPYAYISAGSTTRVFGGRGRLFGIHVSATAGSSVLVADNPDFGASSPNWNNPSVTSTIAKLGTFATANPAFFDFFGLSIQNALTVAATSSAPVTVIYG
mgnify:CR=1 FL=1